MRPAKPANLVAVTDESPVADAPSGVRPIVWRGYPLHYAIPVVVGLIGFLLLLAGGLAAWFGGWWLATALPIAIGGLFRDPRLVVVPVAVWGLWLAIGAIAGPDASLANTPILIAFVLAGVGAGATYAAQRVIFPATDPEVLEALRNGRVVPTLDDGADADPSIEALPVEDGEDLDPVLVEAIEMAEETELEAIAVADDELAPTAQADDEAQVDDEPAADDEPVAEPVAEPAADDEPVADADAADADAADAEAEAEADDEPLAEADEAEADDEAEPEAEVLADADADATEADADDDPLDEGQHVAEFAAITEADLEQADAGGPLPAATRAGRRRAKG